MQTPPAGHVSPLRILALLLILVGGLASVGPARAVEAVRVGLDQPVIDLTGAIERYRSDGDLVQISTAAGKDGIKRRIVVKARDAGGLDETEAERHKRNESLLLNGPQKGGPATPQDAIDALFD